MYVLTADMMRREEERGYNLGVSYEKMMRTAGNNTADVILDLYAGLQTFTVVCGKGKNGGDGFVVASKLAKAGKRVYIILSMGYPSDDLSEKMYKETYRHGILSIDFKKNPNGCRSLMSKSDCLIDAVFGIGFKGEIKGSLAELAGFYNSLQCKKVAVDIPSGLSCDISDVPEIYFNTDVTVTMHTKKPVHIFAPSSKKCGCVYTVGIGFDLPEAVESDIYFTDIDYVRTKFPQRSADSHKGSYGFVLSVCGSYKMPGAAVMAAESAVLSGAGLVAAAFPDRAYNAISSKLAEQIYVPCPSDSSGEFAENSSETLSAYMKKASVILFGCGAGTGNGSMKTLEYIIKNADCPIIIDADGINLLSVNINLLKELKVPCLITPHPGEMSRLLKRDVAYINANRIDCARDFAKKYNISVLLKGNKTVICSSDGGTFINTTGNPGMAVGGSGDILSGITASFTAQGLSVFEAAVCGAYVHGAAGDLAAEKYSMLGTSPRRCLDEMPYVLLQIEK